MNFNSLLLLTVTGIASWYGEEHRGKPMANGRPFNPDVASCASYDYPLGTVLRVKHGAANVIVTVTDRGPNKRLGRKLDLSRAAFTSLAAPGSGLITVQVEVVK